VPIANRVYHIQRRARGSGWLRLQCLSSPAVHRMPFDGQRPQIARASSSRTPDRCLPPFANARNRRLSDRRHRSLRAALLLRQQCREEGPSPFRALLLVLQCSRRLCAQSCSALLSASEYPFKPNVLNKWLIGRRSSSPAGSLNFTQRK